MNTIFVPINGGETMAISRPRMISPFYGHPIDNIPDLLKPNIIGLKATKLLKDFDRHQNIDKVIEYYAEYYVWATTEIKEDIINIIVDLIEKRNRIIEGEVFNFTHIN